MRIDEPGRVRDEYASEQRLAFRNRAFRELTEGADAVEEAFRAVAEVWPRRVLEVGCGEGELAARLTRELDADVVALDLSRRMVELARAKGVDARVGDVQALPLADGSFDCALAGWMLYHVADLDRALAEIVRVLAPGGRLVATTYATDNFAELWKLVGRDPEAARHAFREDSGEQALRRHFARVEMRDVVAATVFPDDQTARAFIHATIQWSHLAARLPPFDGQLRVRNRQIVFVADKAA